MSAIILPHYGLAAAQQPYIQSDGNQYINTNYVINVNTIITLHAKFMEFIEDNNRYLYGKSGSGMSGEESVSFHFRKSTDYSNNNQYYVYAGGYDGGNSLSVSDANDKSVTFEHKDVTCTVYTSAEPTSGNQYPESVMIIGSGGSEEYYYSRDANAAISRTPDHTLPLYLFANNNAGTPSGHAKIKLYYFCISERTETGIRRIKEYIPATDPSGTACLYDTVNRRYAYNEGTGQFICGVE